MNFIKQSLRILRYKFAKWIISSGIYLPHGPQGPAGPTGMMGPAGVPGLPYIMITEAQRNKINQAKLSLGFIIYNRTAMQYQFWNGEEWEELVDWQMNMVDTKKFQRPSWETKD